MDTAFWWESELWLRSIADVHDVEMGYLTGTELQSLGTQTSSPVSILICRPECDGWKPYNGDRRVSGFPVRIVWAFCICSSFLMSCPLAQGHV
jgi:hypothetical protein